jgi:hypothetical protein
LSNEPQQSPRSGTRPSLRWSCLVFLTIVVAVAISIYWPAPDRDCREISSDQFPYVERNGQKVVNVAIKRLVEVKGSEECITVVPSKNR